MAKIICSCDYRNFLKVILEQCWTRSMWENLIHFLSYFFLCSRSERGKSSLPQGGKGVVWKDIENFQNGVFGNFWKGVRHFWEILKNLVFMGFSTILKVKKEKEKRVIFPKTGAWISFLGIFSQKWEWFWESSQKQEKNPQKRGLKSPKTEIGIHFWEIFGKKNFNYGLLSDARLERRDCND